MSVKVRLSRSNVFLADKRRPLATENGGRQSYPASRLYELANLKVGCVELFKHRKGYVSNT